MDLTWTGPCMATSFMRSYDVTCYWLFGRFCVCDGFISPINMKHTWMALTTTPAGQMFIAVSTPAHKQPKQNSFSFRKCILSLCFFLLNWWHSCKEWFCVRQTQVDFTVEPWACETALESLEFLAYCIGAMVVAKLLVLILFPGCEFILLTTFEPVAADGVSRISPNKGSDRILTCFSMNATKSLNRALRLDLSSMSYWKGPPSLSQLKWQLRHHCSRVSQHVQLLHVLQPLQDITTWRQKKRVGLKCIHILWFYWGPGQSLFNVCSAILYSLPKCYRSRISAWA